MDSEEGNGDPGGSVPRRGCYRDVLMTAEEVPSGWGLGEEVSDDEDDNLEEQEELDLSDELRDVPRLVLSSQERKALRKPWSRALIIKLVGKSLPYNFFVERLRLRWRIQGEFDVIDIGNGFFVVKIPSREDRVRVLSEGPWVIAGHYLSVQSWKPNFDPFQAQIKKMAVWVRLPFLPFEYYQPELLRRVGNLLGKTLKVDRTTELAQRGKFARLCVEIDVAAPLVPKIIVGSKIQKVEYEGLGVVCFSCGCIGHREESCPMAENKSSGAKIDGEGEDKAEVGLAQGVGQSLKPNKFGPWMMVQRRNSFSQQKVTGNLKKGNGNLEKDSNSKFQIFGDLSEEGVQDILDVDPKLGSRAASSTLGIDNLLKVTKPIDVPDVSVNKPGSSSVLQDISQEGFKFNSGKRSISVSDGKENVGVGMSLGSIAKKRRDKRPIKLVRDSAPEKSGFGGGDVEVFRQQMKGIATQLTSSTASLIAGSSLLNVHVPLEPKPPDDQVKLIDESVIKGFLPLVDRGCQNDVSTFLER